MTCSKFMSWFIATTQEHPLWRSFCLFTLTFSHASNCRSTSNDENKVQTTHVGTIQSCTSHVNCFHSWDLGFVMHDLSERCGDLHWTSHFHAFIIFILDFSFQLWSGLPTRGPPTSLNNLFTIYLLLLPTPTWASLIIMTLFIKVIN